MRPICRDSANPIRRRAPTYADAARAVLDLASDLRLRQVDVLGVGFGAAVALELAANRPDLVRRLVLVGTPPMDRIPPVKQPSLVMRSQDRSRTRRTGTRACCRTRGSPSCPSPPPDPFDADAQALARQISAFLDS